MKSWSAGERSCFLNQPLLTALDFLVKHEANLKIYKKDVNTCYSQDSALLEPSCGRRQAAYIS